MLDQLSAEVYKLERAEAVGNRDQNDTRDENKSDGQDGPEEADDKPSKETEAAVRGEDEDFHDRPRAENVRQEPVGRGDPPGGPEGHSQNRNDNAADTYEFACNPAGGRGEPLNDDANKGHECQPPGAVAGELWPPEQMVLERPLLPMSPSGMVKSEEAATTESAQLRSELREARDLAEKFRVELSAAQNM